MLSVLLLLHDSCNGTECDNLFLNPSPVSSAAEERLYWKTQYRRHPGNDLKEQNLLSTDDKWLTNQMKLKLLDDSQNLS